MRSKIQSTISEQVTKCIEFNVYRSMDLQSSNSTVMDLNPILTGDIFIQEVEFGNSILKLNFYSAIT